VVTFESANDDFFLAHYSSAPPVDGRLKAREFGPLAGGGVKSRAGQKREGPVIKTEPSTTGTWS
jgi:hypothetical protein